MALIQRLVRFVRTSYRTESVRERHINQRKASTKDFKASESNCEQRQETLKRTLLVSVDGNFFFFMCIYLIISCVVHETCFCRRSALQLALPLLLECLHSLHVDLNTYPLLCMLLSRSYQYLIFHFVLFSTRVSYSGNLSRVYSASRPIAAFCAPMPAYKNNTQ